MSGDDIFIGNVAVGIVPSAAGFAEKMRAAVVPSASGVGGEWGGKFNEGITSRIGDVMGKWSAEQDAQAKTGGDKAASSYAASFKTKVNEALRDIPPIELTANASEADATVQKLRAELEELQSKRIGIDLSGEEAMAELDKIRAEMVDLRDHPAMIETSVVNWQESLDKVAELREMASKPIVQQIVVESKGGAAGEAGALSGLERDAEKSADTAGTSWGANFMGKIKGFFGGESEKISGSFEQFGDKAKDAGKDAAKDFGGAFSGIFGAVASGPMVAAAGAAVVAVAAVMGEKLDLAQRQLEQTIKLSGGTWEEYASKVKATGAAMAAYGVTQDVVDGSVRKVLQVTGNMTDALKSQQTIADIAASQHISFAAATDLDTRALTGNAKSLKQLGDTLATGATQTAAMKSAQKDLSDQINAAGGMADFAKAHHLSLAAAQKTVTAATHGNITAMNELGILVLPKSATAAERFDQVNKALESRMGGQAAITADTFGGKIKAVGAQFMDAGESLGMRLLPPLEKLMDFVLEGIPYVERFGGAIVKIASPVVGLFFKGLADIFKLLFGPLRNVTLGILALAAAVTIVKLAIMAFEAATPFGWVILAVTALIILIGVIDKFHTQIIHGIEDAVNEVKRVWGVAWGWVKDYFVGIWHDVEGALHAALQWIQGAINDIIHWIKANWMLLVAILLAPMTLGMSLVIAAIIKYRGDIMNLFKDILNWIRSAWNTLWSWVSDFLSAQARGWEVTIHVVFGWIVGAFNDIIRWIRGAWSDIWGWTKDFLLGELHGWQNMFSAVWGWIKDIFHDGLSWVESTWSGAWNKVADFMGSVWGTIKKGVSSFWGWIKQAFSDGVTAIKNIWGGIESAIKGPMSWLVNIVYNKGIVSIVDGIAGVFGKKPLNTVPGFATGTSGAPPGWAWVGEQGPELVNMKGGETVLPHHQSMATGLWGNVRGFANGTGPGGQSPAEANPQSPAGQAAEIARESQIARAKTQAASPDIVGEPVLHALKNLVGKALNLGLHHAIDPILGVITEKFPQTFGTDVKGAIEKPIEGIIEWLVANDIPQSSGSEENALEFMLKQVGKRYSQASRYGPDSWDCSGLVWGASHHAGIPMPGGPGPNNAAAIVDPELQWVGQQAGSTVITDPKKVQRGDYIGFHASDQGTFGSAKMIDGDYLMIGKQKILTMGHIGMVVDPKTYVSAYDTQMGVITSPISGDQFGVAVRLGGASGPGPAGGATGSEMQNGIELYQYLGRNLFGGNKIAAAGAIASIWGESTWNPFAQGTGGRGLIGWTPPGTISNADFNGGMKTQLPAILKFVTSSGDSGVIAEMFRATSILQAANLWGKGVERYGINDVHSQGLALATQIANKYAMGTRWAAPGWAMVGENGAEMINLRGGENILTHEQSLSALSRNPSVPGFSGGTMGHADMATAKSEADSMKSALREVEKRLGDVVKATRGVGSDVASNMNGKVARPAANRGAYNNGMS